MNHVYKGKASIIAVLTFKLNSRQRSAPLTAQRAASASSAGLREPAGAWEPAGAGARSGGDIPISGGDLAPARRPIDTDPIPDPDPDPDPDDPDPDPGPGPGPGLPQ